MKIRLIALALMILAGCHPVQKIKPEVVALRCEYLDNPVGMDLLKPRLSWQMKRRQGSRANCLPHYGGYNRSAVTRR